MKIAALLALAASCLCAQDITGTWQGTLQTPQQALRIVIKIEKADQFRPNSNSSTIPVTTPTARLMRKIRPKKRLSRSHVSSFRTSARVCMTATRNASPMVMGTKKKWNTVTMAN